MSPVREIPEVREPEHIPRSRGLGALLENSLVRFLVQTYNRMRTSLADVFRYAVESTLESVEGPLLEVVGPVIDDLLALDELPASIRNLLTRVRAGTHPAPALLLAPLAALAIGPIVSATFSGLVTKIQQGSANVFNTNLLDFGTWFLAVRRNRALEGQMMLELGKQGWTEQQVQAANLVAERWPDASELMTLWRRGDLSEAEFGQRLDALGVPPAGVDMFRKLKDLIPGPSDLVRMAVREAWRDDVAQAWGYDQGYVAEFGEWMEKQGFPAEWARKYWRSHWMTPSIGQGIEMWFRDEISEGELEDLLKINDLAPGWVAPLMATMRPVPGRIDRRWAYEEGAIGPQELFDLYKSDGYDDFWAGVLTETVIKRAVSDVKGLTRASVERAYRKRRISPGEALDMLADLGIQPAIAAFYLEQVDQDRAEELLDRRADAVEKGYLAGLLSEGDVYQRLGALGVSSDEIEADLEVWNIVLEAKTRRPSRANLDKWFLQGTIGPPEYREHMSRLRYSDAYTGMYLESLAVERADIAEKDERAARAEQERIRQARIKTDYQKGKAEIDKDIAELQAAIADAQVALVEAQNERDQRLGRVMSVAEIAVLEREYKPLIRDAAAAVEVAQMRVADLRVAIREIEAEQSEIKRALAANRDVVEHEALTTERLTLDTQIAGLARSIAGRTVTIREIQEQVPTEEDPAVAAEMRQRLLTLKREIAEFQEEQAEKRERQKEIDEALQETLSLEQRDAYQVEIAELAADVGAQQAEIERLRNVVREVQIEKAELTRELQAQIEALPGRDAQVAIRLEYDSLIDEIESRIAGFKSNIAELRIAKSLLTVEYRSVD